MVKRSPDILMALMVVLIAAGVGLTQPAPDTVGSIPGIEIETSVDRAEMYIGDLITYRVVIRHDSTFELIPPPLGANLGAFDVKDVKSDIVTKLPDGRIQTANEFTLSTFTTGDYVIPAVPMLFELPGGERKVLMSEAVPITVKSLLLNDSDSLDIKPLKAQKEFERDLTLYYVAGGAAALVLASIAIAAWWLGRRRRVSHEIVDTREPWERAFEELAMLKQSDLLPRGEYKQYYVELTDIARGYLGRVFVEPVLDMTTDEFVERFRSVEWPSELHEPMTAFLRHADLVKFAKMQPESSRPEHDFTFIHEMVETVRADYLRRQALADEMRKANRKRRTAEEETV